MQISGRGRVGLQGFSLVSIIGYEDISDFRNVIQCTRNHLERDTSTGRQSGGQKNKREMMLQLAGKLLTSPQMLYEEMNESLKKQGFDLRIDDRESYIQ